jgi:hypothetical protein
VCAPARPSRVCFTVAVVYTVHTPVLMVSAYQTGRGSASRCLLVRLRQGLVPPVHAARTHPTTCSPLPHPSPLRPPPQTKVTEEGRTERWIVASCGHYSVVWNFRR